MCPSIHASRLSKLFTMLQKSVRNSTTRLIVNQRFVERSKPVTQPLKKNNLPTFTSTNKKTVSKKKGENRSFEGRLCFIFAALHSKGVKYNLKSYQENRRGSLTRKPVWLQGRQIYYLCDIHITTITRKSNWKNQPPYMIFVDNSKAFDTVDRKTLWKVRKLYGCP